jgi:hypothetical protein
MKKLSVARWNIIFKTLFLGALALALSGCATKEYYAVQDECTPGAYQQFPVNQVQMYVPRTRTVQVATGGSHCRRYTDGNETRTHCEPEMRTEYVQYQSLEIVDTNTPPRDAAILNCTRRVCMHRYGNPDCEPPK